MSNDKSTKPHADKRRAYQPPKVVSEETFERLALACVKTNVEAPCIIAGDTFS